MREAVKRAFDAHFASYRLSFPDECLGTAAGGFTQNGWEISYRFGDSYADCYATNRMTNDRLYRVRADGEVELVASSTDGTLPTEDDAFYTEVRRRGFNP